MWADLDWVGCQPKGGQERMFESQGGKNWEKTLEIEIAMFRLPAASL